MKGFPGRLRLYWEHLQDSLAGARSLPVLSIIGMCSGVLAGVIVVLFRWLIETCQAWLLPGGDPENYEALPADERLLFLLAGSLLLSLSLALVFRSPVRLGIAHVMERLAYNEGYLAGKTALLQFYSGAIAIISGFSVGREGPCIHLGAAGASLLGQWLHLPNNSIRTLVACGTAAAIAASFNTPLAGVIFAMEVIVMEYTIAGFTPVILAAVSATVVNRLAFGDAPVFPVVVLDFASYQELPLIALMGIVIGAIAALFITTVSRLAVLGQRLAVWMRLPLVALFVALCAWPVPEVMGIGYDTVNSIALGYFGISALALILVGKFLATAVCTAFGVPAGFIGPSLFLGAVAGGLTGALASFLPLDISPPVFYTMLGMGAMMGAVLQAPLAALIALLELTANQHVIFPGMLAIVCATLTCRDMFHRESILVSIMAQTGLNYRNDPVAQSLRRLAVGSVMNESFAVLDQCPQRQDAEQVLGEQAPHWLVIKRDGGYLLMPAVDLARYLEENPDDQAPDLLEIPSRRLQLGAIRQQATLQQAYDLLNGAQQKNEALYVIRSSRDGSGKIYGIVTKNDIEEGYRAPNRNIYF